MENSGTNKRPGEADDDPPRKLSKVVPSADDDFSTSVRKKLSASSRTGQACDRCKVRKIKCDGNPGGCSPCLQAQHTCKTTDRNNGRTVIRGHTDRLEWENRQLRERLQECERRLREAGVPVTDGPSFPTGHTLPILSHTSTPSSQQSWNNLSTSVTNGQQYATSNTEEMDFAISRLSILKGTTLSLFGMHIDVAVFTKEHDDPASPTSYETFIKYALGKATADPAPPLPVTLDEAKNYAMLYLRTLNPYTPILHKSDFFTLLERRYERHSISAGEEVTIQMLFGEMKYQIGVRNRNPQLKEEAFAHYKYSLGFYNELLLSRKTADIQALLLIAVKQRNFPKPGAAWQCATLALNVVVELGWHRSANSLPDRERKNLSNHQKEMRKRLFWIAYTLCIALGTKLGLPLPLRAEEIDIEFPEPVPDNLPDEPEECSFLVGIAAIQLQEITSRMFSAFFVAKRDLRQYVVEMTKYHDEIRKWRASLTPELADHSKASNERKVQSIFIEFWQNETLFYLRHPVLHSSTDTRLNAENSKIILDITSNMLACLIQQRALNVLDGPWVNTVVCLAAIFTTLFIQDQRHEELSATGLQKLEADMVQWLEVMRDIGHMLGTGDNLHDSTRYIVEHTMENIRRRINAKSAAVVAAQALNHPSRQSNMPVPSASTGYNTMGDFQPKNANPNPTKVEPRAGEYASAKHGIATPPPPAAYAVTANQTGGQYPYSEPSVNGAQPFEDTQAAYPQPRYAIPENSQIQPPVGMHTGQPPQAPSSPDVYTLMDGQMYFAVQPQQQTSPMNDWLRWSLPTFGAFSPGVPQEFSSANALVALGGRNVGNQDAVQNSLPLNENSVGQTGTWPMNLFNLGQQNGNGGV